MDGESKQRIRRSRIWRCFLTAYFLNTVQDGKAVCLWNIPITSPPPPTTLPLTHTDSNGIN
ncbi:MAG: hypothetical protein LBJ35_01060 [Spirochaetaceae bacterium]|nr:hypothetical protein [Spirochaetaceae bacterium]